MADPKKMKWGPKGMLVAKAADTDTFVDAAVLGPLPGIENLPTFGWSKAGMSTAKYIRAADLVQLDAPVVPPVIVAPPAPAPTAPPVAPAPAPPAPPAPAPAKAITTLRLTSTSDKEQTNVPVTFGHVFARGEVPAGASVSSTTPIQVDAKATHPDGSLRHAVISTMLPKLRAREKVDLPLSMGVSASIGQRGALTSTGAQVSIILDGVRYTASPDTLSVNAAAFWLSGPTVAEPQWAAPLRAADGTEHPHLHTRFAIRYYPGGRARVDVVIENDWAYEPNPQNFTYDVLISIAGRDVYAKKGLEHRHHSRWREVFWVGEEPQVHVAHDTAYLIASRALPNYDQSVRVPEEVLASLAAEWTGPKTEPMGIGLAKGDMPGTGGRRDIGLLPGWAATYLLSMDARAKMVTLGTADRAGSWTMHYRDKNTGYPISVLDFPYMTLAGKYNDTRDYSTGKFYAFPALPKGTSNTGQDNAHQPGFAYLPYLVTGDYYYLEELQFWGMYNILGMNPGYRKHGLGLLAREQVRGQAWCMRTLGEAAYITPDNHPLKSHFTQLLNNNLEYYNAEYTDNPNANKLGVIVNGYAVGYKDETDELSNGTGAAPWQDDFFTSAIGHLAELGFVEADRLLRWKSQFVIGRMVGEGVCWSAAANYTYQVRPKEGAPFFETFREAYADTVGEKVAALPCGETWAAFGRKVGDLGGYPTEHTGFPANMQPAMAYAAKYNRAAWDLFDSRNPKGDYRYGPQSAIVPRDAA